MIGASRRVLRLTAGVAVVLIAGAAFAQAPSSSATKLAPVSAVPGPGAYTNTLGVELRQPDPAAVVRYTLDGSAPSASSPKLDKGQLIFLTGVYEGDRGLKTGYTLRAAAFRADGAASDPVTLQYGIDRRDRTAYVSEEVAPGVRMIRDSDNDKMFLVRGTKAYALIDSGLGRGALRTYVEQFTGGLPVIPIFTHSHGDHIGQANQFIEGSTEYIGAPDRAAAARFLERQGVPTATVDAHLKALKDGDTVDLGDRKLEIYAIAGHTPGSIAILDPASGNLFTGDSVGNNSALPPDVLWMQGADRSLDVYLANVRTLRARLGARVKLIMTGHNDKPLVGTTYLDNVEKALQRALDQGDAALIPSWRPAGLVQVVEGDRVSNPNWFGANLNRANYLPAATPDQVAGLTGLVLGGAKLGQPLDPAVHDLKASTTGGAVTVAAIPTSSRSARLTIDGKAVAAGQPVRVSAGRKAVPIVVTAPDGKTTATYNLTFAKP